MQRDFQEYLVRLRAREEAQREQDSERTYHKRQTEREGRSNLSGGNFGGGTWGGRSRSEGEQP